MTTKTSRRDFIKIGSAAALGVAALGVVGTSASAAPAGPPDNKGQEKKNGYHGEVDELWESLYPITLRHYPKPRKIRQTWIKDWPSPAATAVIVTGTPPTSVNASGVNGYGIEQTSIAHKAMEEFLEQNGYRIDGIKMLPAFITTRFDEDYLMEKNKMYAKNGSPPRMDHGYWTDLCGHTPQIPFIKNGLKLMKMLGWAGLEINYNNNNVAWPWTQWEALIKYAIDDLGLEVVFELLDSPPALPSRGYFTGEEIIGFAEPFLEAGCSYLNIDHRNTERMAGYPATPRLPAAGYPTVKLEVQKVIDRFGWEHLTLESDSNIYPAHVNCFFDDTVFGANVNINNIVPNQLMAVDRLRDTRSHTPIP